MVGIGSALENLHDVGVIHRDTKPCNVLICDGNMTKLMDCDRSASSLGGREAIGAMVYVAKELRLLCDWGQARVDGAERHVCIGHDLHEILAREVLFNDLNLPHIAMQAVQGHHPDHSSHEPDTEDLWALLVEEGISHEPSKRPDAASPVERLQNIHSCDTAVCDPAHKKFRSEKLVLQRVHGPDRAD